MAYFPGYTISSSPRASVSEGNLVSFTFRMEGTDGRWLKNTTVPYEIVGLSAADIVGGALRGSVRIDANGFGTLSFTLAADRLTEGAERFFVTSNANRTPFRSNEVVVNDTSLGSPPPATSPPSAPPAPPAPPPAVDRVFSGTTMADDLTGTSAKDTFEVSHGADRYNGAGGIDTYDLTKLYQVFKAQEISKLGGALPDTYSNIIVEVDLGKPSNNLSIVSFVAYRLFNEARNFDMRAHLTDIENIIGSTFNDRLIGNASGNVLNGGVGNDTLSGLGGNDTLIGGAGTDTAVFAGRSSDYTVTRDGSSVRLTMGGTAPETDVLIDVERVQFSNATIDVATLIEGTKLATARTDVTSVNEGASIRFQIQTTGFLEGETVSYSISGVADADIVGGRASNSVRVDAAGRAFVDVQLIADRLTEGNETLTFSVKNSSVNVTVVDTSVRPPTITESDDRIYGTTQNDLFDGRGGNDRITGASGSDTLIGGLGNDTLIGDDDADVLLGGVGNDFLSGGNGDDLLEGGAGQDELVGSAGRDTFVFRAVSESGLTASNADVIDNFVRGEDRIDLGAIDAFSATSSNDTFIWRGTASFSSTTGGEVSFQQFRSSGSVAAHTMIWIDTDQDAAVEMAIRLPGLHNLTEADFIL